jgi:hypothetical protein
MVREAQAVQSLAAPSCGLSDGSVAGDWKLPNVREMLSLIDYSRILPALPAGHPFTSVGPANCTTPADPNSGWSYHTSSLAIEGSGQISVSVGDGEVRRMGDHPLFCSWAVRK